MSSGTAAPPAMIPATSDKTLEVLNRAFKADAGAIRALVFNRIPCNVRLADDPNIQVHTVRDLPDEEYAVGVLGLINGILEANGLPLVAAEFQQGDWEAFEMTGFREIGREQLARTL